MVKAAGNPFKIEYPFMPRVMEIEGLNYSYVDEGTGGPVVMVHGNPTWSFFYRKLILGLKNEYRVIAPDHMGMGLSSKPQDYPYTLETHINNFSLLMDRLDLENITLCVHDWGGAIGMGWAVRNPDRVKRLVIFNTAAFPDKNIPPSISLCRVPLLGEFLVKGLNGFAKAAITWNFAVEKPERISKEAKRGYLMPYSNWRDRVAIHRFVKDIPMEADHPTRPLLEEIASKLDGLKGKPVRIFWGMKDFCFNEHFLNRWLEYFPHAVTDRLEDAGHYVVEDAWEKILPELQDFLKG